MSSRVNRIRISMDVYVEFEGKPQLVELDYAPEPGDPLVTAALAEVERRNLAAAIAAGPATGMLG